MAESPTQNGPATDDASNDGASRDLFARLAHLGRSATGANALYVTGFREIASTLGALYGHLTARLPAEVVEDTWHRGPDDPNFWRAPSRDVEEEAQRTGETIARVFRENEGSAVIVFLACPFDDGTGAVTCVIRFADRAQLKEAMATLRSAVAYLTSVAGLLREHSAALRDGPGAVIEAVARSANASSRHELAYAITNGVCTRGGFEQAALGVVSGRQLRILSISGFDDLRERNPGVRVIKHAMEECLDRGDVIVCQHSAEWGESVTIDGHRLHRHWHAEADGAAVASIPLRIGDDIRAILSVRARPGQKLDDHTIDRLGAQVTPYTPALELVDRASRSWLRHGVQSVADGAAWAIRPGAIVRKSLLLALLCLAGWVAFGTLEHRIAVDTRVVPMRLQHVVAPYEGVVVATYVRPGDRVEPGQMLYQLSTRELELQRDEVQSRIDIARIEERRAIEENSTVDAELARANQRALTAQRDLLDRRIELSTGYAAEAGFVMEGELQLRAGQVVSVGEPLYVIAPDGAWMLELAIPEDAMDDVTLGATGAFASEALPDDLRGCTVERILPRAEERNGGNVFVAEAALAERATWMKPGMEGVTRLEFGRRPVWWLISHKAVESIRKALWL